MEYEFRTGETTRAVTIEKNGERWRIAVDGRSMEVEAACLDAHAYSLIVAGRTVTAVVVRDGGTRHVAVDGYVVVLEEPGAVGFTAAEEEIAEGVQILRAPMPGKVVKILVPEGESVAKGQTVLVVEAMKMEHGLGAAGAGVVRKILCAEGESVTAHQPLAEVAIGS
jgi:biotin carboxyl carrier protein